jgi:hypothetical protein
MVKVLLVICNVPAPMTCTISHAPVRSVAVSGSQCALFKKSCRSWVRFVRSLMFGTIVAAMVEMLALPKHTDYYSRYAPRQTGRQGVRIPRAYEEANAHGWRCT